MLNIIAQEFSLNRPTNARGVRALVSRLNATKVGARVVAGDVVQSHGVALHGGFLGKFWPPGEHVVCRVIVQCLPERLVGYPGHSVVGLLGVKASPFVPSFQSFAFVNKARPCLYVRYPCALRVFDTPGVGKTFLPGPLRPTTAKPLLDAAQNYSK